MRRLVASQKFHATLRPRIDAEVDRFMAEQERIDPPAKPVVREGAPGDPDAPANTAAGLGGPLSIHAPWRRD
jgi:hypothetical protein